MNSILGGQSELWLMACNPMWLKTREFVAPVAVAHLVTDGHPDSGFKLAAPGGRRSCLPRDLFKFGRRIWLDELAGIDECER